jgi:abhydrolase domain-containing protein 4
MLRQIEKTIMKYLRLPYRGFYVDVGSIVSEDDKLWTLVVNENAGSKREPILLLHGLGAGSALWILNYDEIAKDRPVYAIDLPGFGRSSRSSFDKDSEVAEMQFIRSIEEWRKEVNLQKFVLLGHSFGAYLACSYALTYPSRVSHLILADPWGFPEKPKDVNQKYNVPLWVKSIAWAVQPLNPLWLIRAAGPFGQKVVEKTRPDIMRKYQTKIKDDSLIPQYLYQCNSQNPTGESAFHSMMEGFGWAKNPMINRINEMRCDVPITLIYGSRSWVDNSSGEVIKKLRPHSYVKSYVINQAGHHVYADKPEEFNSIVVKTCELSAEEILKRMQEEEEKEKEIAKDAE